MLDPWDARDLEERDDGREMQECEGADFHWDGADFVERRRASDLLLLLLLLSIWSADDGLLPSFPMLLFEAIADNEDGTVVLEDPSIGIVASMCSDSELEELPTLWFPPPAGKDATLWNA